jgi:hypothetical protein
MRKFPMTMLFGNIFKEIEEFVEKLFHPVAKETLADAAAYLSANKETLVAEAGTSGVAAEVFLTGTVTKFMGANPNLAELIPIVEPVITTFLTKEIGYGTNDVGTLIDKLAAYLIAEEAVV